MSEMDIHGASGPGPDIGETETGPAPEPAKRRGPSGRVVLAAVVAGSLLIASGFGIGWGLTRNGGSVLNNGPSTGQADRSLDVQAIADRVDPAVIDVKTYVDLGSFSSSTSTATPLGAGTGMVLTPSGEVLTNNHVIEGATKIEVAVPGRSGSYSATVLGADPPDDVALLQIQGVSGLPTVTLGDSSSVSVGQQVVAIGNALGQGGSPTVTEGTVTSLGRSITVGDDHGGTEHLTDLIQTDASISPGDSGGPLVNSSGEVVGIITASARGDFLNQPPSNVGFAIPSDAAFDVVRQVRTGNESSSVIIGQAGFLGVQVRDLDPELARQLGLSVTSGALVVGVVPGTPAADAGISADSVITAVDGTTIASADALGPALHHHQPGDRVRVTWVDGNGTHTTTTTLINGPAV